MEDEEEVEETSYVTPRRITPVDPILIVFGLAQNIAGAFESALSDATQILAGHANYIYEQRRFHEDAALDIEMITNSEED